MFDTPVAKTIKASERVKYTILYEFQKRWPQINRNTRVVLVQYPTVVIEMLPQRLAAWNVEPIIETWDMWWDSFFFPKYSGVSWFSIDKPETRFAYQDRVMKAILRFPKLVISWLRGEMKDPEPPQMTEIKRETIELELFGWQYPDSFSGRIEQGRIRCAYDTVTDTFYVMN